MDTENKLVVGGCQGQEWVVAEMDERSKNKNRQIRRTKKSTLFCLFTVLKTYAKSLLTPCVHLKLIL